MAAALQRAQLMGTAAQAAQARTRRGSARTRPRFALLLQTEEDDMKRLRRQGQAVIRRLLSGPREGGSQA